MDSHEDTMLWNMGTLALTYQICSQIPYFTNCTLNWLLKNKIRDTNEAKSSKERKTYDMEMKPYVEGEKYDQRRVIALPLLQFWLAINVLPHMESHHS